MVQREEGAAAAAEQDEVVGHLQEERSVLDAADESERQQHLRREELRRYLSDLARKRDPDGLGPLVDLPSSFSQMVEQLVGPSRQQQHVAPLSKGTDPALSWLMDPQVAQGMGRVEELDRRLRALEGRLLAMHVTDPDEIPRSSPHRPPSTAASPGGGRMRGKADAASVAESAFSQASRLRPEESALVERLLGMDDDQLDLYLANPFEPPTLAARLGQGGDQDGHLQLQDIEHRLLEFSAQHGWNWQSEIGDRTADWVGALGRPGSRHQQQQPAASPQREAARPASARAAERPGTSSSSRPGAALPRHPVGRRSGTTAEAEGLLESEQQLQEDYLRDARAMRELAE